MEVAIYHSENKKQNSLDYQNGRPILESVNWNVKKQKFDLFPICLDDKRQLECAQEMKKPPKWMHRPLSQRKKGNPLKISLRFAAAASSSFFT